jgi:effector-binding domain-containing protein
MKIKTLNHLSEWYHFLEASQRVMFYGAGYYLKMAVDDLRTKGIAWREKVSCVIVSSRLGNPDEKYGLPVVEHKSVQYEAGDCIVLTLGEPFWDEVTRLYEQMDVQVIRLDFNMFQEDEYEEIYRELEPFLTEFQRNQSGETVRTMPQEKRAWTMWWQGVDAAPAIIRACLASQKKYMPKDVEYVVLTKGNIKEYVEIPDDLLKKVDAGSISLNHLSDFIRSRLLYLRGGLWMDASIYLLEPYVSIPVLFQKPSGFAIWL